MRGRLTFFSVFLILLSACAQIQQEVRQEGAINTTVGYNPQINPSDFSSNVDNKYFKLTPGQKMVYESKTEDGIERIETYVTNEKRSVMGVETVVVWDRVWLNGDLIEDTRDWYAQDKEGNVWYFGEDTSELIGGKIINHAGAWEAGVDNAKPGIIMKANPQIGDSYRQEYYAGIAEDMADVLSLVETAVVPYGTFTNCIKTRDYTPLEPGIDEHKYYCPELGGIALEVVVEDGERVELISVEYNAQPSPSTVPEEPEELKTGVTEEQAKAIALARVPGIVKDVAIETKFGKATYVVEILAESGTETDVIIDINTGEILAVET